MQSLFIKPLLLLALFVWKGPTVEVNRTPLPQEQSTSTDKSSDRCDFSSYLPVRIKQFDRKAIVKRVQPEYPVEAIQDGIQGRVVVKALVNEEGIVERACCH